MERKIGEIFEYNGEWYQCLKSPDVGCKHCDMNFGGKCPIPIKECVASSRSDLYHVIFKKLEKAGEPVTIKGRTFQKLILDNYSCTDCVFNIQNKKCCKNSYIDGLCPDNEIWVEIKQNKEDMEDLDKIKVRDYTKVEELNVMEENKLNLKPFDIQKAREGKPVCTRDGRKARIICFDAEGGHPIIALVSDGVRESPYNYAKEGYYHIEGVETMADLMMLPEKKEGWINIIKTEDGGYCCKGEVNSDYNDAFIENINVLDNRGITVKIEWEE